MGLPLSLVFSMPSNVKSGLSQSRGGRGRGNSPNQCLCEEVGVGSCSPRKDFSPLTSEELGCTPLYSVVGSFLHSWMDAGGGASIQDMVHRLLPASCLRSKPRYRVAGGKLPAGCLSFTPSILSCLPSQSVGTVLGDLLLFLVNKKVRISKF